MKWKSITDSDGQKGVRYREHPSQKYGAIPDRYYSIFYWWQGKTWNEGVGWASQKVRPSQCFKILETLKNNQRNGKGPCTLAELKKEEQRRKEAEEAETRRRAITLADYEEQVYKPWAEHCKPTAFDKEESHIRLWIKPAIGKVAISEIKAEHWDQLIDMLTRAKLSQRTKEYITGTLRRILKHAYERRLIDTPPPSGKRVGITAPKNNRRLRIITPAEAEAILDTLEARDIHAWRFVKFAFLTGCRASEVFKLTWGNVSLDRGAVTFSDTKNTDNRTLPLSKPLLELLKEIEPGPPDTRVFTDRAGNPYKAAPTAFKQTVIDLKLNDGRSQRDRLTFHSIRHSVATSLAQKLNLRDLQEVMGWRTVQMAVRYVHGDDRAKLSALDGLAGGPDPLEGGKVLQFKRKDRTA